MKDIKGIKKPTVDKSHSIDNHIENIGKKFKLNKFKAMPSDNDGFEEILEPDEKRKKEDIACVDKFSVKSLKKEGINNSMRNKSDFEKLYKFIMESNDDLEQLGIETDEESDELDLDTGEDVNEEEGTITVQLTTAQVDVLRDILSQLSEDETQPDEDPLDSEAESAADELGIDLDSIEDEDEEEDNYFGEETDTEELGAPLLNQKQTNLDKAGKGSNVVKSNLKPSINKVHKGKVYKGKSNIDTYYDEEDAPKFKQPMAKKPSGGAFSK